MRVLLTGGGGFLGQRIAERLLARGVEALDVNFRQPSGHAVVERLRTAFPGAQVEAAPANLLDKDALARALSGIDCVVHAAAQTRGGAADMIANSVVATRNLLEAAGIAGVRRIVLVSSFSVYETESLPRGAMLTESTPTEPVGIDKGGYAYSKIKQEQLFLETTARLGIEGVVLRPGVIYGPGGGGMSPRVGIAAMGCFFALGGGVLLPLTYVDNCADAIALATVGAPAGSTYNVVDDDLPSCRRYLAEYRRHVRKLRVIRVPYWALMLGARVLVRYHRKSKGQLPAVFTPYLVRSMYRPLRYSNAALKTLGWRPLVATADGLSRTFAWLAAQGR
jgi:nucleoside-diphosphate-sugar epimerase